MNLVTNGRLITRDADGKGYYEHGAVAFEGTKIVEVGEEAALRAITIDAARICRVDGRLGSLRVGKDADLAIFDGSPLVIASRVRATVVGGRIVYRPEG